MPRFVYSPKRSLVLLITTSCVALSVGISAKTALADEATPGVAEEKLSEIPGSGIALLLENQTANAAATTDSTVVEEGNTLSTQESDTSVASGIADSAADASLTESALSDGEDAKDQPKEEVAKNTEPQSEQVLANGEYVIAADAQKTQVLDVVGNSKQNEATVSLWETTMGANQRWNIAYNKDFAAYTIQSVSSGKFLDVKYASAQNGAVIQQYDFTGGKNQLWKIEKLQGGSFRLLSLLNEAYALDMFGANTANGTKLELYLKHDGPAQAFRFFATKASSLPATEVLDDTKLYTIDSKSGRLVASTTAVSVGKATGANTESFSLIKVGGTGYKLRSNAYGLYLDVKNGSVCPGSTVQLSKSSDDLSHVWVLTKCGEGNYSLVNASSGLSLGVAGGRLVSVEEKDALVLSINERDIPTDASASIIADGLYHLYVSANEAAYMQAGQGKKGDAISIGAASRDAFETFKISRVEDSDYYRIALATTGQVLDVSYRNPIDGANLGLYDYTGGDNQLWKFVKTQAGYYLVSKLRPDFVIDAFGELSQGTRFGMWSAHNGKNQLFSLEAAGMAKAGVQIKEGAYQLFAGQSDSKFVVDVSGMSLQNGADIILWTDAKQQNQKFYLKEADPGFYYLININSGKVLDVANNSRALSAKLIQWELTGGKNQQWAFYKLDGGGYEIRNRASNLALDVMYNNIAAGSRLSDWRPNNNAGQRFYLRDVDVLGEGIYSFFSKAKDDLALDVFSYNKNSGATVGVWNYTGGANETFGITKTSDGHLEIRAAHSGKLLSAQNNKLVQVGKDELTKSAYALWDIVWTNSAYTFKNVATGLVWALDSLSSGAKVVLQELSNSSLQSFIASTQELLHVGAYSIRGERSEGKNFVVTYDAKTEGASYTTWQKTGGLEQRFVISKAGSGYRIVNSYTGGYVSVSGGQLRQTYKEHAAETIFDVVINDQGYALQNRATKDIVLFDASGVSLARAADARQTFIQEAFVDPEVYYIGNRVYTDRGDGVFSASGSLRARFVNEAIAIAQDNSHGYTQGDYRFGPDYDCSSLMYHCGYVAGLPLTYAGLRWTGSLSGDFVAVGALRLAPGSALQVGDILLKSGSHTCVYIGNGKIAEAWSNEFGGALGGRHGDQTGQEIRIRNVYSYGWTDIIRLPGNL